MSNVDLAPEGDGGCPSIEYPATAEEDEGSYAMEGIADVKVETSSCTTVDDGTAAQTQQGGTGEKPVKVKRKKSTAACNDKIRPTSSGHVSAQSAPGEMIPGHIIAGPAPGDSLPGHTTALTAPDQLLPGHATALSAPDQLLPGQTTTLPGPDHLVTPPVMKGNLFAVRSLVL